MAPRKKTHGVGAPNQVPSPLHLDQGEVPKPGAWPTATRMYDSVTGGQKYQPKRPTVTHCHASRLQRCGGKSSGASCREETLHHRSRR